MRRDAWLVAALLVFGGTVVAHWGSLDGGFVYDDHRFIEHNRSVRSIPLVGAFTDPGTASHGDGIQHDIYRPLRTLLFSVEYALFARERDDGAVDFHLRWWHFLSVLLHAINAVLVLRLLRPLVRGAAGIAAAGALLFAVHPLTSESVAWLSSQGDLLAMSFALSALIVLERRGVARTVIGAVCFALACLSKESALVLPALLPLRDLALPRDDVEVPSPWARATWIRTGVLAGVAMLYFAVRLSVLPGLAQVEHAGGSVLATARGMANGLVWYAQALLWPAGFSFDTRIDVPLRWTDPEVWVGLGLLGTTIAAGVFGLVRKRYLLAFATLGFLVLLGPVSNVIVPLKTFVADRFLYPGLLCVGAGLAALLLALHGTARIAALTIVFCLLGALAWLTMDRNASWADEASLWTAVREDRPGNANAYQGMAFEYGRAGRVAEAERALASYLEANPDDGKSTRYMGDLFGRIAAGLVQLYDIGGTSHDLNRSQARFAQIRMYRRALEIWEQPGGLLRGRGSEAMRAEMLDLWIQAAADVGDVRSAKFANDYLIDLEARGEDYTSRDAQAVMQRASWWRRRTRVMLALTAVRAAIGRQAPKELEARILEDLRMVVADVGLDPRLARRALPYPLRGLLEGLIAEAIRDPDLVPDAGLFLERASLLMGEAGKNSEKGRRDAARALEEGLRVLPGHPLLVRQLRGLQGA